LYSACLFFSLPRRHPRPTLFPYTTLFRSGPGKIGLPICTNLVKAGYRVLGYRRSPMTEFAQMGGTPAGSPAQVGAEADIVFACLDRKSTRLNSSHVKISYAVFCLKKKKKK